MKLTQGTEKFAKQKNQKEKAQPAAVLKGTPRKNNMEHNHGGLEDHVPFKMGDLYVPC